MSQLLDGTVKGWPALGISANEVPSAGLVVEDLPTPVLVAHADALDANIAAMQQWCDAHGCAIAPHAKTTMAPAILRRQLAAGAWGLTVADVRQAAVAVAAGAQRVLVANVVVTDHAARALADLCAAGTSVRCWVDSLAGAQVLAAAARRAAQPLEVLLEVGYPRGRTGVRGSTATTQLAAAVAGDPWLRLGGVSAYEGLLGVHDRAAAHTVDSFLDDIGRVVGAVAEQLESDEPIVTAGGSAYFDRVVGKLGAVAESAGCTLVLRSGCYVTHDHGVYAAARAGTLPRLTPALEVRVTVLSRPEPGRVIVNAGRRDMGDDAGVPIVLDGAGTVVALNDQHAHIAVAESHPVRPGDVVRLGVSHPCTTIDRWRVVAAVDRAGRVVEAFETCF